MPHGVMVALFALIVTPLALIVWWEYMRARGAPRSVSKAFKRHIDGQAAAPPAQFAKKAKRGFDAWD